MVEDGALVRADIDSVFETDGHRVRTYHVGLRPQVAYVERCG